MLRIGLIGRGTWGQLLHDRLGAAGAEVVTVDPALDGQLLTAEHPGPVDAFVVASPANTHADVLDQILTLPAVPVFCEKPFTTDTASAERLAAAFGNRLHLMHVWRYHAGIERLGELARSGHVGEIHGVRSTRTNWTSPRTDVDTTWTLLPHDLTIAIEILGHIPTPQSARAELLGDRAVGLWADLGSTGRPWLIAEVSNRFADKRREVRVHGSEGVAVLPGLDARTIEVARGNDPTIEHIPFDNVEPVRRELDAFLAHVAGGPPPKSDAVEGVAVIRAVEHLRSLAGLDQPT